MTERLARVSAQRPLVAIALWVVLVAVAVILNATLLGSATTTEFRLGSNFESQRADALLKDRLRGPEAITEIVIVQSDTVYAEESIKW